MHKAFSTVEKLGFAESILEFMRSNKATLETAGVNVSGWLTELEAQKSAAAKANDEQEALKAKLRDNTDETNAVLAKLYDNASKIDAMAGTLGKKSELAKQVARLRSGVAKRKKAIKKNV